MSDGRPSSLPPVFGERLAAALRRSGADRVRPSRWILVFPDQLSLELGALRTDTQAKAGVLFVESGEWLSRRPYHRQRLGLLLLSQRAFALEVAESGRAVEVLRGDLPMVDLVRGWLDHGRVARLDATEPAEREMRAEFAPLRDGGRLHLVPHDGFLTTQADLDSGETREGFRMDRFYQAVRKRTGILMERGKPIGGKYSFDAENRKPWHGEPAAPEPLRFASDALRNEVQAEIEQRFADHPGELDLGTIAATRAEVDALWKWARERCLPQFGPFEDAMSRASSGVFHTRISPAMNLHRLLPRTVVADALAADLPLASQEGFVRQVLGWREFVYQVHRRTDGFRSGLAPSEQPLAAPGDAGFARWAGRAWRPKAPPPAGVDGGARPNALSADLPLPTAWWGAPSGLACLDHVVADVWREGWSHHITRLMVLSNIATLADISPRELCDWFWVGYIDAWDWVVEPNVLAMGTYANTSMTTKPYVSGSAYLAKMSDYCGACRHDPKKDCPIGPMYWAFLARKNSVLCDNPRLKLPLASARGRSDAQRTSDARAFVATRDLLIRGVRQTQSVSDEKQRLFPA
jgi:deoxyribodipyrimidine photolyase-related protein